jgi:chorismate-pyruvate lyase
VRQPDAEALQRLLLDSRDTATHFLEVLTGEPLLAEVVQQSSVVHQTDVVRQTPGMHDAALSSGPGGVFDVTAGEEVLRRIAVLRGRVSAIPYVYAESTYLPGRLPDPVQRRLAGTTDPIGRVLSEHGLRQRRHEVSPPQAGAPPPIDGTAAASGAVVCWRAYRLDVDEVPVFAIAEWFFRSVLDAMARRGRPARPDAGRT